MLCKGDICVNNLLKTKIIIYFVLAISFVGGFI